MGTECISSSDAICDRVSGMQEFKDAGVVLAYWPLPGEVDLRALICNSDKRFALPVVVGDSLILREYSPEHMEEGYRGIMEPSDEAQAINPDEIGFALIPGVAFDRKCRRLGRGRGYYDRLLPSLHCPAAGVAFGFQILEEVPTDPWDKALDLVVTPSDIFRR